MIESADVPKIDSIPPPNPEIFEDLFLDQARITMLAAAEMCGDWATKLRRARRLDAAQGALECEEMLERCALWFAEQIAERQETSGQDETSSDTGDIP